MKHYNAAHIWGRVAGVPTSKKANGGKGRPYLRIKVNCSSAEFGNVSAYGRLWIPEQMKALIDYLKKNPGAGIRFKGFFSQYEDGNKRFTNFTFYEWFPDTCERPRVSFILLGQVMGVTTDTLALHLERGGGDYAPIEEDFELYSLDPVFLRGLTEGDLVKVKGYLRSKEGEDEFGDASTDPVKPYISELQLVPTEHDASFDPGGE